MRVLFIDDRKRDIERLINLSGINREHQVETEIFTGLDTCLQVVQGFEPEIVFIGHGLSAYPLTGSDVIRHLRSAGVVTKFIANSGGGAILFENDGVEVDGSANRCPGKITALLAQE